MRKFLKRLFLAFLLIGFLLSLVGAGLATWGYFYITRDLPDSAQLKEYRFKATSFVYSDDGTLLDEFYDERRYPVKFQDIPARVRNAFLAAEDASFYKHPGIDIVSIGRAVVKNFQSGSSKQGGSTITQQVVKNLLLNREKTLTRKIREAILSYRIEQNLSKDEILELYLNQLYLGNTAYGVKAAAQAYFRKDLADLTIAEAAMIAGLPAAPSEYSPVNHPEKARVRQVYVLGQMLQEGMITKQEHDDAVNEKVKVYPASTRTFAKAPYYIADVEREFTTRWRELNLKTDGLKIYTAVNLKADEFAAHALKKGLKEVDKRRGWRGPLKNYTRDTVKNFLKDFPKAYTEELDPADTYPVVVTSVAAGTAKVQLGNRPGIVDLKQAGWAKKHINDKDETSFTEASQAIRIGDVIEVSFSPAKSDDEKEKLKEPEIQIKDGIITNLRLDQTPEIEGALVLLDPHSGKVLAEKGGYDFRRSPFNRASQALRQPGSSFKPILYLAAVDKFQYTPSTIVNDAPRTFRVGDEFWTPGNYDGKYSGSLTLRTALEKSRNLVSADIISKIGVDAVIQYARLLGIESPIGRNLSISLGSSEVTLLELSRAYGVFPARGTLFPSAFITKIVDRKGEVLFDYESEKLSRAKQVVNENSAFVMSWMMKGVVDRGTATRVKVLGRPVAGKTGTSNELMDTWFIGYTPEYVCGVWVGFDQKRKIGEKETGGAVAAPIFTYFMQDFLALEDTQKREKQIEDTKLEAAKLGIEYQEPEKLQPLDFLVPPGVDPYWVDHDSGILSKPDAPGAILEYFTKGTEPGKSEGTVESSEDYLKSPDL